MHSFLIFLVIGLISLIWLYKHLTRNFDYWKKLNIPFPEPLLFFGNIYDIFMMRRSICDLTIQLYNSAKTDCVGFFVFDQPFLLICNHQLVKQILISDFDYFNDRTMAESKHDKISSNILFLVKNPKWRSIRSKVSPIFTAGKIKSMLALIIEASKDLKCYIKNVAINSTSADCRAMALNFSTDIVSSCACGINARSFDAENSAIRTATKRFFDWNFKRSISTMAYFIAPILVKLFRLNFVESVAGNYLYNIFWKLMNEREISNTYRGDLLDIIIELKKSNQFNHLDPDLLTAQPIQFMFAGFETTGAGISYALYCLAKNPSIQDKLRQEIKTVLKKHGDITYEALQEMKLLERVINEVLRLFPGLPWLDRRCTKSCQLNGTDIVLEKGIPVYIPVLAFHYDPKYFPDPYKFDPERFSDENKINIVPGVYMPFGDGPRSCIGVRFALMALKVALIQVLTDFEVETCSTTPDPLTFVPGAFLLTPTGGKLDLHFKMHVDTEN